MRMVFGVKLQDLRYIPGLVIGGPVVDLSEHINYLSTIKNLSVRSMLLIAEKWTLYNG